MRVLDAKRTRQRIELAAQPSDAIRWSPHLARLLALARMETLPALTETALAAAKAGGALVTAASAGRTVGRRSKSAGDYVTDTDLASERAIREALAGTGIDVVGEEAGGRASDRHWLVDPLDGTTNFLHGFPAVGVSIALVSEGQPVIGVVFAPLLGQTWVGWRGGGAWLEDRRIRVSSRPVSAAVVGTGFPFRRKENIPRYLDAFVQAFDRFEDLRRPGAAALDLAWVAEGVFDGFFELGLGAWDLAAGGLLVREAGGLVTDWNGDEMSWLDSGDVVAGPPAIHQALLDAVRRS
jgi:myo-inositol-1(or 4)-monophosphatase